MIGNELLDDTQDIAIHDSVNGTLVQGNYANRAVIWNDNISDKKIPHSLYISRKPDFFGDVKWPIMGADLIPQSGKIPA